ncbi:hypothetical protein M514_02318 [Trichuris suis]|uniref:Uncharacterized protein n=1 Tax=Trichuris suis TaxID=68888 RepID=A0A085NBH1_9BILA|nr:hypothetical protein M513_02318 [Trichuris suis]KFD66817.1 hypothetical protein M514_02318 [Trichuris suis]
MHWKHSDSPKPYIIATSADRLTMQAAWTLRRIFDYTRQLFLNVEALDRAFFAGASALSTRTLNLELNQYQEELNPPELPLFNKKVYMYKQKQLLCSETCTETSRVYRRS